MKNQLKSIFALFALVSCFTTTTLSAYEDEHKGQGHHAVPPPKHPGEEHYGFFVGAYYTYWVPYQEDITFAQGLGTAAIQGGWITPAFTGQSGFKVCVGGETTHDNWVARVNYTWFYNEPTLQPNTVAALPAGYISYFASLPTTFYSAFSSQFQNQFNRVDGQLDRTFYAGHYMTFRPWAGLLGAWDQQYLRVIQTTTADAHEEIKVHQNWWGIGPYAGCEGNYYFTECFAGFISSGVGLLLANHQVTAGAFNLDANLVPTGTMFTNMYNEFNDVEPMLEATLGLRWDGMWPTWGLCVDLAWETQTFFDHNSLSQLGRGNYSMQGLTVGAKVSF